MDSYLPSEPADDDLELYGQVYDSNPLPLLEREEAGALIRGFLRSRGRDQAPFVEMEFTALLLWAQRTRLDATLLKGVRLALIGLNIEGPEIIFESGGDPETLTAADGFVAATGDSSERMAVRALVAARWRNGNLPSAAEEERIATWARVTEGNNALLSAFLAAPDACIDIDHRGRIQIYPADRVE